MLGVRTGNVRQVNFNAVVLQLSAIYIHTAQIDLGVTKCCEGMSIDMRKTMLTKSHSYAAYIHA